MCITNWRWARQRILHRLDLNKGDVASAAARLIAIGDHARRFDSPRERALAKWERGRASADGGERAALPGSAIEELDALGLPGLADLARHWVAAALIV